MTSPIGGTTKGDSNSFDGEETGFTGEERAAALGAASGEWQEPFSRKQERDLMVPFLRHAPTEIRTPVLGLKGLRPSPLDDGGVYNGKDSIILPLGDQARTVKPEPLIPC